VSQLRQYNQTKAPLIELFRNCGDGKISSQQFFEELPRVWGWKVGNRLKGDGWERSGKGSDFQTLAKSFLRIVESSDADRDDTVVAEIDYLSRNELPTRNSFLSEMLCLAFPSEYPVLNQPVKDYLKAIKFRVREELLKV
jgi:hypothetical protein